MSEKERLWKTDPQAFIKRVIHGGEQLPDPAPRSTRARRLPARARMPFAIDARTPDIDMSSRVAGILEAAARVMHDSTLNGDVGGCGIGMALVTHLKSLKSGAEIRSLEFALSDEAAAAMMHLSCHYCGLREKHRYNGIDRVDNKRGYVEGNVVPCCRWCNYAKGGRHVDDFMRWLRWVREGR